MRNPKDLSPEKKKASARGIKQPAAWEPLGKMRELADLRGNMQEAEWAYRFSRLSGYEMEAVKEPETQKSMLEGMAREGLLSYHFASQIDYMICNNEGLRATTSEVPYLCNAWPICSWPLHHCRAARNRGRFDEQGARLIQPHIRRSYFAHGPDKTGARQALHDQDYDQTTHTGAVNDMLGYLLDHRGTGFELRAKCLDCKAEFVWMDVAGPVHSYRTERSSGSAFRYDILGESANGDPLVAVEVRLTHQLGRKKREAMINRGFPFVEVSAKAALLGLGKGIHRLPGGRLMLDAFMLEASCSDGDQLCAKCRQKRADDGERSFRLIETAKHHGADASVKAASLLKPLEDEIAEFARQAEDVTATDTTVAALTLYHDLSVRGLTLTVCDDGKIAVSPASRLTDEDRSLIRGHKPALGARRCWPKRRDKPKKRRSQEGPCRPPDKRG